MEPFNFQRPAVDGVPIFGEWRTTDFKPPLGYVAWLLLRSVLGRSACGTQDSRQWTASTYSAASLVFDFVGKEGSFRSLTLERSPVGLVG